MTENYPIRFDWDGEVMRPANAYWAKKCDALFVIGQHYELEQHLERSTASHRAYFAEIKSAWENLPEDIAHQFPSAEALRKYALVKSGHCNQNTFVCETKSQAQKLAAFLRPMDEFGMIDVRGTVVTRYVPHSQSYREMDKERFRKSRDDVLRVIGEILGIR